MLPDRSKVAVAQRLFALPDKSDVRFVAMDMWNHYRDAVRAVLPKATIVVDKFHVVRMANESAESVRKALREGMATKERRGLMHDRYILLRRERDLDSRERFLLDSWTKLHPLLGLATDSRKTSTSSTTRRREARQKLDMPPGLPTSLRRLLKPSDHLRRHGRTGILRF
jgi:transposase